MIPVIQTKLNQPEKGIKGNCLAAAVASIFEVGIDEVPAFETYYDREDSYYWELFLKWLGERGATCFVLYPGESEIPDNEYLIASGLSPRGTQHAVVWKDGKIVHDPHPSSAGFIGPPDYYIQFVKVNGN